MEIGADWMFSDVSLFSARLFSSGDITGPYPILFLLPTLDISISQHKRLQRNWVTRKSEAGSEVLFVISLLSMKKKQWRQDGSIGSYPSETSP